MPPKARTEANFTEIEAFLQDSTSIREQCLPLPPPPQVEALRRPIDAFEPAAPAPPVPRETLPCIRLVTVLD